MGGNKIFGLGKYDKLLKRSGQLYHCKYEDCGKNFSDLTGARHHARKHDPVHKEKNSIARKARWAKYPEKIREENERSVRKCAAEREEANQPLKCSECDFETFETPRLKDHQRSRHPEVFLSAEAHLKRKQANVKSSKKFYERKSVGRYFDKNRHQKSPKPFDSQDTHSTLSSSATMNEIQRQLEDDYVFRKIKNRYVYLVLIAEEEAQMIGITNYFQKYRADSSKQYGLYVGKSTRKGPAYYHSDKTLCKKSTLSKLAATGKSCFVIKTFEFSNEDVEVNIRDADKCEAYLQLIGFSHNMLKPSKEEMNWTLVNSKLEAVAARRLLTRGERKQAAYLGLHGHPIICFDYIEGKCEREHNNDNKFIHYMKLHLDEEDIELYEPAQPEDGIHVDPCLSDGEKEEDMDAD